MLDLEQTKKILNEYNIMPRQSLGQNFLVSKDIINKTIEISNVTEQHTVLEIGPGLGALTSALLETGAKVIAYEIDRKMIQILEDRFNKHKNLFLDQQDILKVNLASQFTGTENLKIIANLPYYISAEIIEKLICELPFAQSMTLMLQKEAIERITLKPNDSRYGPTAILIALYGKIEDKIRVPANCFFPRPKINSQVILIEQDEKSLLTEKRNNDQTFDLISFNQFLHLCFAQRRKTLRNNLKNNLKIEIKTEELVQLVAPLNLDLNLRPEQISPKKFWQLYQSMANYISKVDGGSE